MATLRDRLTTIRLALRRTLLLRRRLLAALLAGVAVFAGLRAAAPPSVWVVTAAHDLDGGAVLVEGDLTRVAYADGTAPDGATTLDDAVGRTLAAPLRRGEPVTDVRLVGPGLLTGYDTGADPTGDMVALPVRVPDAGVVALVRVGDLVDLLATDPSGGGTTTVATDVPVLALPQTDPSAQGLGEAGTLSGRLVVVGTTRRAAEIIENAAVQCFLSLSLSPNVTSSMTNEGSGLGVD